MAKKKAADKDEGIGMCRVLGRIKLLSSASKRDPSGPIIDVCRSSESVQSGTRYVLSTGIEPVDHVIGGGFPFGKITEVYGVESSGKTALVLRSLIRAQLRHIYERDAAGNLTRIKDDVDITLVFVDNEQSIEDTERIVIDGVKVDCVLTRCDTVDQIFKIFDTTMSELEKVEKETKRKQLVVIIVDTVAGTASREEMSANWDKEDYPRSPKALRRGFRILARRLQRRNVAAIFTNQVSLKFDGGGGGNAGGRGGAFVVPNDDQFSSPGGKALKFWAHCRLFLNRERDFKITKAMRFPSGFVSYAVSTKNRMVPPLRFVRMCLLFHGGISSIYSILETLCTDKSFAERGKSGVVLKLAANGVPLTSFGADAASKPIDDENEDEPDEKAGTITLASNADWPDLYLAHPEFAVLWEKYKEYMFSNGLTASVADAIDGDVDDDDEMD